MPPGPAGTLLHSPPCPGVALAAEADTGTKLGGEGAGAGMTLDADEAGGTLDADKASGGTTQTPPRRWMGARPAGAHTRTNDLRGCPRLGHGDRVAGA